MVSVRLRWTADRIGCPGGPLDRRAPGFPEGAVLSMQGCALREHPDCAVDLLAQDVGVPGVPGGIGEHMDHDVEQLHVSAPPGNVTGSVDGESIDRRVLVFPYAPVEADDLVAGLVLGGPELGVVRGLVVPPGQGLGERPAEDLAEVP
jgi:hypothetical protein